MVLMPTIVPILLLPFLGISWTEVEARPFRFEAAWLTHDAFDQLFKKCWSKAPFSLPDAIKSLTQRV
ncbi:hypothetical protein COLO4_01670 [Corchorus olitorius]|uniref:Uncharacterized protein n=1 Tax=Corchorus olitorius TaxID=93759 RepID=A0A1R3L2E1_9ROSI|nr:hypothetical protein COLO4_01670 [Corchorus olitorius]